MFKWFLKGCVLMPGHQARYRKVIMPIVDLLNPKTRKLIWRGSIAYEITESTSPEQKRKKIAWTVARVLENFPPQKPGQ